MSRPHPTRPRPVELQAPLRAFGDQRDHPLPEDAGRPAGTLNHPFCGAVSCAFGQGDTVATYPTPRARGAPHSNNLPHPSTGPGRSRSSLAASAKAGYSQSGGRAVTIPTMVRLIRVRIRRSGKRAPVAHQAQELATCVRRHSLMNVRVILTGIQVFRSYADPYTQ